MFVGRARQFYSQLRRPSTVAASEVARALTGGGPTFVCRGAISVEPRAKQQDALPERPAGRNGRATKWTHRPPTAPGRSGHIGGLYNVDVPRGGFRVAPLTVGDLLDTLREPQMLTVHGPVSLGDTCVRNLRADVASMLEVDAYAARVGRGGLRNTGRTKLDGPLETSGGVTHAGDVYVDGSMTVNGPVTSSSDQIHTNTTIHSGPTIFEGPVVVTTASGDELELEVVDITVVTDVYWDSSAGVLRKATERVFILRSTGGDDAQIIDSESCA